MKRAGFTMIELIFVIVILGILAAVAIPKLAATRDDAKATANFSTYKTAVAQIQAASTASGVAPTLTALLDASPDLALTGTTFSVSSCVTGTVNTVGTVSTLDIDVNATAATGASAITECALFDGVTDSNITLVGSSVTR